MTANGELVTNFVMARAPFCNEVPIPFCARFTKKQISGRSQRE
jgi:hypothetical protein